MGGVLDLHLHENTVSKLHSKLSQIENITFTACHTLARFSEVHFHLVRKCSEVSYARQPILTWFLW